MITIERSKRARRSVHQGRATRVFRNGRFQIWRIYSGTQLSELRFALKYMTWKTTIPSFVSRCTGGTRDTRGTRGSPQHGPLVYRPPPSLFLPKKAARRPARYTGRPFNSTMWAHSCWTCVCNTRRVSCSSNLTCQHAIPRAWIPSLAHSLAASCALNCSQPGSQFHWCCRSSTIFSLHCIVPTAHLPSSSNPTWR